MPADFETGFVVRTPAWHGLADVLDEPLTARDALVAAGQDWEVAKAPLFAEIPGDGSKHIDRFFATYRTDTNTPLGVVGKDWTPVQNFEAFQFMDDLVGGGDLLYESCGVLRGGQKVYMLARHPENMTIAGDEIRRYLLCWNGHAGTLSFGVKRVNERVVCSNTLGMALSEDSSTFKARHSSGIEFRTAEARDVLGMSFKHDEQFEAMAERLLADKMSPKDQENFAERLMPFRGKALTDQRSGTDSLAVRNVLDRRNEFLGVLRQTEDLANINDTAWGALQAATEFADWHTRVQGKSTRQAAESRFARNWMKDDPIKLRAMAILAPGDLAPGVLRKVRV